MLVLITKTNSDYGCDFRNFIIFEDLIRFKNQCREELILKKNIFYNEDIEFIKECYHINDNEKAEKISQCEYEIEIYNGYRE